VGHADWYAGNMAVIDGQLAGIFDWELVADTEAVIAGFTASCYAASPTGGGGLSTPEEVAAFLQDYEEVRAEPLSERERRAARRCGRLDSRLQRPLAGRFDRPWLL
jgi:hypothetical protein